MEYVYFIYIKPFSVKKDQLAIEILEEYCQEKGSLSQWTSVIFGKTIPFVEMETSEYLSLSKIASFN